jgi:hypothetical protein
MDIARVMRYYEEVAGAQLADKFYAEIQSRFAAVAKTPEAFTPDSGDLA